METSIRKTVRRTITSSGGDVEHSTSSKNYQVYRGMSPTTSNRLEQRMKELEEALEAEREAHSRTEKELSDANFLVDQLNDRLEEAEGATSSQADAVRKKEQEVLKVKKELELLNVQVESTEVSLKKRSQEVINEVQDQLSKTSKQKSK